MAPSSARARSQAGPGRSRAQDVDRFVGSKMRERRIMLGLTQQQMAELIGVTYQQAHKYEKGINRIAAGRLFTIAQALGVDVSYFFQDIQSRQDFQPSPGKCPFVDLAARRGIGAEIRRLAVKGGLIAAMMLPRAVELDLVISGEQSFRLAVIRYGKRNETLLEKFPGRCIVARRQCFRRLT